jgi:threonine/homoserine/homoserine lactone efflux protein
VMTAFGINVGILFWVLAAALGLAAVVSTSTTAFAAIKLAGAAYLVYLGVQALARLERIDQRASRFDGPRVKRTLEGISGLVLVGLGTRLALERR